MNINNLEIDAAIIACLEEWNRQVKTAMVIGWVILYFNKLGHQVEENVVANRIYLLEKNGDIVVFGDVKKWHHSEIILSNS